MSGEYRLVTDSSVVIRVADNAHIPADPGNADRLKYEVWLRAGNTPLAAIPPPVVEPLPDLVALLAGYEARICALEVLAGLRGKK